MSFSLTYLQLPCLRPTDGKRPESGDCFPIVPKRRRIEKKSEQSATSSQNRRPAESAESKTTAHLEDNHDSMKQFASGDQDCTNTSETIVKERVIVEPVDDVTRALEVAESETVQEGKSETMIEGKSETVEDGKSETVQEGKSETIEDGRSGYVLQGKSETVEDGKSESVVEGKSESVVEGKSGAVQLVKTAAGAELGHTRKVETPSQESQKSSSDEREIIIKLTEQLTESEKNSESQNDMCQKEVKCKNLESQNLSDVGKEEILEPGQERAQSPNEEAMCQKSSALFEEAVVLARFKNAENIEQELELKGVEYGAGLDDPNDDPFQDGGVGAEVVRPNYLPLVHRFSDSVPPQQVLVQSETVTSGYCSHGETQILSGSSDASENDTDMPSVQSEQEVVFPAVEDGDESQSLDGGPTVPKTIVNTQTTENDRQDEKRTRQTEDDSGTTSPGLTEAASKIGKEVSIGDSNANVVCDADADTQTNLPIAASALMTRKSDLLYMPSDDEIVSDSSESGSSTSDEYTVNDASEGYSPATLPQQPHFLTTITENRGILEEEEEDEEEELLLEEDLENCLECSGDSSLPNITNMSLDSFDRSDYGLSGLVISAAQKETNLSTSCSELSESSEEEDPDQAVDKEYSQLLDPTQCYGQSPQVSDMEIPGAPSSGKFMETENRSDIPGALSGDNFLETENPDFLKEGVSVTGDAKKTNSPCLEFSEIVDTSSLSSQLGPLVEPCTIGPVLIESTYSRDDLRDCGQGLVCDTSATITASEALESIDSRDTSSNFGGDPEMSDFASFSEDANTHAKVQDYSGSAQGFSGFSAVNTCQQHEQNFGRKSSEKSQHDLEGSMLHENKNIIEDLTTEIIQDVIDQSACPTSYSTPLQVRGPRSRFDRNEPNDPDAFIDQKDSIVVVSDDSPDKEGNRQKNLKYTPNNDTSLMGERDQSLITISPIPGGKAQDEGEDSVIVLSDSDDETELDELQVGIVNLGGASKNGSEVIVLDDSIDSDANC